MTRVSTTATVPSDGTDHAGPRYRPTRQSQTEVTERTHGPVKAQSEVHDTVLFKSTIDSDSEDEDSESRSESVTPAARPESRTGPGPSLPGHSGQPK